MTRKKSKPTIARKASPVSRTAATRKSGVRNSPIPKSSGSNQKKKEVTSDVIAKRAYEIFLSGTGGSEMENWLRAERELCGGKK